jgi:excisionase family DNA binding protein
MSEKLLLTIGEAADRLSLGKTFVYELVMRGELESLKLGKARRIPIEALERFIQAKRHEHGYTEAPSARRLRLIDRSEYAPSSRSPGRASSGSRASRGRA